MQVPRMLHVPRLGAAALIASLALAACGGAGVLPTTSNSGPIPSSIPSPVASPTRAVPSIAASPTVRTATPASPTSAPPTSAPGSAVAIGDVCAMFTAAELESLTGHKFVGKTTDGILSDEVGCVWSFETPTPGVTWDVVLSFLTLDARTRFKDLKPFAATGSPVPDLGVENYPSGGGIIYALKGEVMVTVQYVNLSDDANREQVPVEVMRRALATLD